MIYCDSVASVIKYDYAGFESVTRLQNAIIVAALMDCSKYTHLHSFAIYASQFTVITKTPIFMPEIGVPSKDKP